MIKPSREINKQLLKQLTLRLFLLLVVSIGLGSIGLILFVGNFLAVNAGLNLDPSTGLFSDMFTRSAGALLLIALSISFYSLANRIQPYVINVTDDEARVIVWGKIPFERYGKVVDQVQRDYPDYTLADGGEFDASLVFERSDSAVKANGELLQANLESIRQNGRRADRRQPIEGLNPPSTSVSNTIKEKRFVRSKLLAAAVVLLIAGLGLITLALYPVISGSGADSYSMLYWSLLLIIPIVVLSLRLIDKARDVPLYVIESNRDDARVVVWGNVDIDHIDAMLKQVKKIQPSLGLIFDADVDSAFVFSDEGKSVSSTNETIALLINWLRKKDSIVIV